MRVLKNVCFTFSITKYGRKWKARSTSINDFMYFYSFLKHYNGMNWKHWEFQTTIQNYNPKCWVEPEIFKFFQHKVERTPHFTQVTEKVYIYVIYLRILNTASPIQYIFQLCVIQHYPPSWTMIHWINLKFLLLSNSVSKKKKSTYVLAQSFICLTGTDRIKSFACFYRGDHQVVNIV